MELMRARKRRLGDETLLRIRRKAKVVSHENQPQPSQSQTASSGTKDNPIIVDHEENKAVEETKSSSSTLGFQEKEERDQALRELIRETENFDTANHDISPFINSPEYIDVDSIQDIFYQEGNSYWSRTHPCSYSVRKKRYETMLQRHTRRAESTIRRTNNSQLLK